MLRSHFASWTLGIILGAAALHPAVTDARDSRTASAHPGQIVASTDSTVNYAKDREMLLARIRTLEQVQRESAMNRDIAHSGAILIGAVLVLAAVAFMIQRRSLRNHAHVLQAEMDTLKEGTNTVLSKQRDEFRREKERQRMFARKLIISQERERKRIARDLHDTIGQDLLVIHNCALLAHQDIESGKPSAKLSEVISLSSGAIENVRRIAYDLRPYLLERIGLTETLRSALERLAQTGGLQLDMRVDQIDGVFSNEEEINVYRIMQEALNNVLHHAHAAICTVEVLRAADAVQLSISDDGCGFDADGMRSHGLGFGLRGMDERVQMLGGSLYIQSAPGTGTRLDIRLPVTSQAQHAQQESDA